MTTMKMNVREARQKFSELINTVALKGERIIITSRSRPKAVIVSIKDAEAIQDISTKKAHRLMQLQFMRKTRKRLTKKGIVSDSTTTLRKMREDRIGKLAGRD